MASGGCISGSTGHPKDATRRVCGGAATMSTPRAERVVRAVFLGVTALLFAASVALTIVWSASMSGMGEMPMPGGWSLSMAWMRMPGQTWSHAWASFLVMWIVMMVAMMLPSLVLPLWRYREAFTGTDTARLGALAAGYFLVWSVFGVAAFPV